MHKLHKLHKNARMPSTEALCRRCVAVLFLHVLYVLRGSTHTRAACPFTLALHAFTHQIYVQATHFDQWMGLQVWGGPEREREREREHARVRETARSSLQVLSRRSLCACVWNSYDRGPAHKKTHTKKPKRRRTRLRCSLSSLGFTRARKSCRTFRPG